MPSTATFRPTQLELLIDSEGRRRRVPITKWPFTIGRGEDCDAAIADARVSRLHARIDQSEGECLITDAGSRHGTFVNGQPANRTKLKQDDEITLGVSGLKLIFTNSAPVSTANQTLLRKFSSETVTSELEKLTLFLEAARALNSGVVVKDVLLTMLDSALRLTKAERGFVYLKQPNEEPALTCGLDAKGAALSEDSGVARSVVRDAMNGDSEFITGDARQQSALAARQSIMINDLRTVIAIPLRERRVARGAETPEVHGVLYLDSRSISSNLAGVSADVLRALAGECTAVLESARLMEAEHSARQYRQEMEIAAAIQRSLISESEVRCDFARISGRSIPCKEVGGDFFDTFITPDAATIVVADVSGKGISAALLAFLIQGMFYAQISTGAGMVEAVTAINRFLCSRVAGQKYATLVAVQLKHNGKLEIVNCGHVPPIVTEGGSAARIADGDLPVGLLAGAAFHHIELELAVGSRLCVVTDGISESENADGQEFGLARLQEHMLAADPLGDILGAVQTFSGQAEPADDRTLVILERTS